MRIVGRANNPAETFARYPCRLPIRTLANDEPIVPTLMTAELIMSMKLM